MNKDAQYNYGAGPACLPKSVLAQIRDDIPDWYEGMSVMEISHRLPVMLEMTSNIETLLREILSIPADFAVLFMSGGARTQFGAIPLNLLDQATHADYVLTGHWSELAYQEAHKYCQAHIAASSKDQNYTYIPDKKAWHFQKESAYVHYTDNETIHGVEFHSPLPISGKWLISDMTSNLLTKPIDFSSYGLIYASAQKNLGIAGITVVIVRKSLLGNAHPLTPSTLNYEITEKAQSMYNTPPVFCWYVVGLILKWVKEQGGILKMSALCNQKSALLYDAIDHSDFYTNPVLKAYRSRVNIPFSLPTPDLEALFLTKASEAGLKQLNGHKLVGGCRASLYNAMPFEGVQALVEFMANFKKMHG